MPTLSHGLVQKLQALHKNRVTVLAVEPLKAGPLVTYEFLADNGVQHLQGAAFFKGKKLAWAANAS